MTTVVLDTSVVAKWFLAEEGSERAELLLRRLLSRELTVEVPSLLFYELANLLWVRRRDGLSASDAREVFRDASALPFAVSPWSELAAPALELGHELGISPYDAAFLALARRRDCELITADRRLLALADRGFGVVRPL